MENEIKFNFWSIAHLSTWDSTRLHLAGSLSPSTPPPRTFHLGFSWEIAKEKEV